MSSKQANKARAVKQHKRLLQSCTKKENKVRRDGSLRDEKIKGQKMDRQGRELPKQSSPDHGRGYSPSGWPLGHPAALLHEFSRGTFSVKGGKGNIFHYRARVKERLTHFDVICTKKRANHAEKTMENENKKSLHGSRNI